MSTTPSIRPATRADLDRFYPDGLPGTIRALAFDVDNEVACVGGIVWTDPMQCFSHTTAAGKRYPKLVWRIALQLKEWMSQRSAPVYALADRDEPTAPRLLTRLGFVEHNKSAYGQVYVWRGD